ncbi:hypothetical protein L226DRAFT_124103 [Lentinus tigrinus ALCF2SS1-7]|uniref:uncharacterized protein n=1 Tax=Lentinus tigrinus ALCF2SS1-7 TaxID=1328758 RepID=UPI001165FB8E|nr:hypothetical protein L226DRAFT_124103 [Lentinus tigrinus ALCF2SS1-7]
MCAAIQQPSDAQDGASQPPPFSCSGNGLLSVATHPQPPATDDESQAGHKIVEALTAQGIRVRDFAYENSKLPPVTSVPRFSVQVQPRPRTLRRTRDMLNGHDDGEESDEEDPRISRTWYIDANGNGVSHAYRYRKKTGNLERTLTEPADEEPPSQGFNTRAPVLRPPSPRYRLPPASPRPRHEGAQCLSTPQRPMRHLQSQSPNRFPSPISTMPQSQLSAQDESQETESWVDTPLVTPNGSLQWPVQNTSALPTSQLESILPQLGDMEHEQNVTLSQLGFSPERSQPTSVPSPADTPSRPRHPEPHIPPPAVFNTRAGPNKSRSTSRSPSPRAASSKALPAPLQPAPAPRYDFRRRPAPVQAPPPPPAPRGTIRTRAMGHAAARTLEKAAPPRKKRKITPPRSSNGTNGTTTATRKKATDVKEDR